MKNSFYIKIDAKNPPERNKEFITNIGECLYKEKGIWMILEFTPQYGYRWEQTDKVDWYLQEISLTDLMIEYFTTPKKAEAGVFNVRESIDNFLTSKGIVIKE